MNRAPELLSVLDELLRRPEAIARRCREDDDLRPLVLGSLLAIVVGAACFGTALGAPRGAVQGLFAGVKLPLALLGALVVSAPAFHVLAAGFGQARPFRGMIALTLAAAGRAALVLLACTPGLWLAMDSFLDYHQSVLAATACYGLAGIAALGVVLRGLEWSARGVFTALAFACVLAPVGGQTAWMFRPFLGRPAQTDIPFVRAREASFADAVFLTALSANGIYLRDQYRAEDYGE